MDVNDDAGQPGCSNEITENDDLVGYISHMSPVMTSGAKKYFNCHLHTKNETRRAVMIRVQKQKSPVKISKFRINLNSPSKDIILNKDTHISPTVLSSENAFTPVTVSTDEVTPLAALKNAVPEQLVIVQFDCTEENYHKKQVGTSQAGWNIAGSNWTNQHCPLARSS